MSTKCERLKRVAADLFNTERRRGWLAYSNSIALGTVDPNITEQEYAEQIVERYKDSDIDELEEMADVARPSNMPTAYERNHVSGCVSDMQQPLGD